MSKILQKTADLLGSLGLAAVVLILLMVLTLFGTLEQAHSTLVKVQQDYFYSFYVVHHIHPHLGLLLSYGMLFFGAVLAVGSVYTLNRPTVGEGTKRWARGLMALAIALLVLGGTAFALGRSGKAVPILLPGAMLLLPLLVLNLLVGGLLRMRRGTATLGVFIIHIGILVMLGGSYIEAQFSDKGAMTLWEGERFKDTNGNNRWDAGEPFKDANRNGRYDPGEISDRFRSHDVYEVVVVENRPNGSARELVIPQAQFDGLDGDGSARFQHADLPFDVVLSGYAENSVVRPEKPGDVGAVDGFFLEPRPPIKKEDEDRQRMNLPGIVVTATEKGSGRSHRGILWARQARIPWTIDLDGQPWSFQIRRQEWQLPFSVQLDRFVHELHPGTMMDSRFSSYVTQTEEGNEKVLHITMNEPLRSQGYTLYQSGWGPRDARPGDKRFSTFAVVANPSDRVPEYATYIIALGMLVHFLRKLFLYIRAQQRRESAARSA